MFRGRQMRVCIVQTGDLAYTMVVYGHPFTRAEDDVVLFEKLESDLMAA